MHTIFANQYHDLITKILLKKDLSIGTLGPEATSSYQALKFFISNLYAMRQLDYTKMLYDNFDGVLDGLLDRKIDLALVPSAYCDITRFFWHPNLKNVYTFSYPTPEYGIVAKMGYSIKENKHVCVSSCEPVKFLIDYLLKEEMSEHEFTTVITPSTTTALQAMIDGKADIAITNRTSYKKYAINHELQFITDCFNTQMIWSVFANKDS